MSFLNRPKAGKEAADRTGGQPVSAPAPGAGTVSSQAAPSQLSDRDLLQHLIASTTASARMQRQQQMGRPSSVLQQSVPGVSPVAAVSGQEGAGQAVPDPLARGNAYRDARGSAVVQGAPRQEAGQAAGQGSAQAREQGAEQAGVAAEPPAAPAPAKKKGRGILRRLLALVRGLFTCALGLAMLVLSLFAVYKFSLWLYHWLNTSPMFVTRHIDVTGNVRLQRDMILHLGGIREGINAFSVSVAAVERRLRQTPWVADVSVRRILPDRFVISVQERMPSFWVRREGKLYYANDRGEIIAPVESSNFMSLPILSIGPGCDDAIPYLARLMKDMRSGILPVEATAIATVDVSAGRGVELYLEDREMRLSLAPDDWEGNLVRLGMAIGDLARRRELSTVREIRASSGTVLVVHRKAGQ